MFNLNDMEHSFCYIMNKRYYFKSKREAIKKLKLGQKEVKDIRKPKLIKDYKYIICGEKIKIKQ